MNHLRYLVATGILLLALDCTGVSVESSSSSYPSSESTPSVQTSPETSPPTSTITTVPQTSSTVKSTLSVIATETTPVTTSTRKSTTLHPVVRPSLPPNTLTVVNDFPTSTDNIHDNHISEGTPLQVAAALGSDVTNNILTELNIPDLDKISRLFEGKLDKSFIQTFFTQASDTVKKALLNWDISKLRGKDLTSVPSELWRKMNEEVFSSISLTQARSLMENFMKQQDTSSLLRLFDVSVKNSKLDLSEIINKIQEYAGNSFNKLKALVIPVLHKLKDPRDWYEFTITQLGPLVLFVRPDQMVEINGDSSIRKTLDVYETTAMKETLITSERPLPQSSQQAILHLMNKARMDRLDSWDRTIINSTAHILKMLTPFELTRLEAEEILAAQEKLFDVDFGDRGHAQPILSMILSKTNLTVMKDTEIVAVFKRLKKLEKYLTVIEFKALASGNKKSSRFEDYMKQRALNTEDFMLGDFVYDRNKPDKWEAPYQTDKMNTLMQFASPETFLVLMEKKIIHKKITDQFINQAVPLEKSLVLQLKGRIRELYLYNNQELKHPPSFIPALLSKEISQLSDVIIQRSMNKFNACADSLSRAQRLAVVTKIRQNPDRFPGGISPRFLSLFNSQDLSKFGSTRLKSLLIDKVHPYSPQMFYYMEKTFEDKQISLKDLRNSPNLIASLTTDMLRTMKPEEIFDVITTVVESPIPPKPKIIKYLAVALKDYLRSIGKRGSTDEELLEAFKVEELELIGGQMLVEFSMDSMTDLLPEHCVNIYSQIGQLRRDQLNLIQPQRKKDVLAVAAAECFNKTEDIDPDSGLDEKDAMILGSLLLYLPINVFRRLSDRAFLRSLPYFQGLPQRSSVLPPPPLCLTRDLQREVKKKLLALLGPVSKWQEAHAWTAGCLLTLLTDEELAALDSEFLMVMISQLTSCFPIVQSGNPEDEEWLTFHRVQCRQEIGSEASNLLIDGQYRLATRLINAAADVVNQYPEDKIDPKRLRQKRASERRYNCAVLRLVGSAVYYMEDEMLKQLQATDFLTCIERLGSYALQKDNARILLDTIIKEFGGVSKIPVEVLLQLGSISTALTPQEISQLHLNDSDVIDSFGTVVGFELDQLKAFAKNVKEHRDLTSISGSDLIILGQLICGFTSTDLETINVSAYLESSAVLSDLRNCPHEVLSVLAAKAKDSFAYGHPQDWKASTLRMVGSVIGGLPPDTFKLIPNTTFEGLTVNSAKSISADSLKRLSVDQLRSFSVEAALSLSEDQRKYFSPEQDAALTSVFIVAPGDSKASSLIHARFPWFFVALVLFYNYLIH